MLHPPRRWDLPGVDGLERITILPRAHAWVADGYVFNLKIAAGIGPIIAVCSTATAGCLGARPMETLLFLDL